MRYKSKLIVNIVKEFFLVIILVLLFSCETGEGWTPKGEVSVINFNEVETIEGKKCKIDYKIKNIGAVKIIKSTISFEINSDKNIYYLTITDSTTILPDKEIFGSFYVFYLSTNETLIDLSAIKIRSSFFE